MIWPILEARAEIQKYFRLFFGSNEDIQKSFWNYLTFRYILDMYRTNMCQKPKIKSLELFVDKTFYKTRPVSSCDFMLCNSKSASTLNPNKWKSSFLNMYLHRSPLVDPVSTPKLVVLPKEATVGWRYHSPAHNSLFSSAWRQPVKNMMSAVQDNFIVLHSNNIFYLRLLGYP